MSNVSIDVFQIARTQVDRAEVQSKKYMSRLAAELDTYRKTGNAEHLLNISVYAYLESRAPENRKFHFDNEVGSATRRRFGGDESSA